jgi:hypothetical protein
LNNPLFWLANLLEHTYYLLPLVVHVVLPFLPVSSEVSDVLDAPLPDQMQRLHVFAWLLGPLVCCALGSYCLDSKNGFCFFPGTPYFHRVVQCNLFDTAEIKREINDYSATGNSGNSIFNGGREASIRNNEYTVEGCSTSSDTSSSSSRGRGRGSSSNDAADAGVESATGNVKHHVSKEPEAKLIRNWALSQNPPDNQSSHWWYTDLTGATRKAFDDIASSSQICSMFRELFSTRNYCVDVVTGMNEIYISGPARFDEAANSDNVFYTRHVDGPFGLLPFVSVYRCIVGLDHNEKVSCSGL